MNLLQLLLLLQSYLLLKYKMANHKNSFITVQFQYLFNA